MALQREEAWKKIHLKAMENPIKDLVKGYDVSFFIAKVCLSVNKYM